VIEYFFAKNYISISSRTNYQFGLNKAIEERKKYKTFLYDMQKSSSIKKIGF